MKFMNGILSSEAIDYSVNPKEAKQKNRSVLLFGFLTAASSTTTVKSCQCTSSHCMCGSNCLCGNQCKCR